MSQLFTNFEDQPVGDITTNGQTDWTPRITNGTADYRVIDNGGTDGKILRINPVATNGSRVLGFNALNGVQDVETLVLFSHFKSGSDGSTGRFGISYNRYDGTSEATTKGFATSFTPASSVKSLILHDDAVGTVNFTNYAWTMGNRYWCRTRVIGNNQWVKIWADGASEPGSWTLTSTYSLAAIASPYSGVGTFQGDSFLYVYQFGAGTNGDTAPSTPVIRSYQWGTIDSNLRGLDGNTYSLVVPGGWGVGYLGLQYGAVGSAPINVTQDRTGTFDSLLKKQYNPTHTIDSLLKKQYTLTNSVDSLLVGRATKIVTVDSLLRKAVDLSGTIDSLLRKSYDKNYTVDSYLRAIVDKTHSFDSFLLTDSVNSRIHAFDSLLRKVVTTSTTFDSLLKIQVTPQHTVDSLIKSRNDLASSVDSLLRKTVDMPFSIDSLLKGQYDRTITINSLLRARVDLQFSIDSLLNKRIQLTSSFDSLIFRPAYTSYSFDSMLICRKPFTGYVDGAAAPTTFESEPIVATTYDMQSKPNTAYSLDIKPKTDYTNEQKPPTNFKGC